MDRSRRVVVIGLDGGTLDVIRSLAVRVPLPNLASLMTEGAWGTLTSTIPPNSAPAWATLATGKNPGSHGVFHFRRIRREPTAWGKAELVNARSIRGPTLWRIASEWGLRVGVINVPMTYPPEPVNGFLIAGMLTPVSAEVFTYPPELSAALTDYQVDVTSGRRYGAVESLDLQHPKTLRWLCQSLDSLLEKRTQTTLRLLQAGAPDLLVFVFTATDRLHHYYWDYLTEVTASSHPPGESFFHRWVWDFYRRLDDAIGQVWSAMGPDAVRLVVSDHGFGAFPAREFYPNVWLRQRGWLRVKTGGLRGRLSRWQTRIDQAWLRRALSFLPKHRQRAVRTRLGQRLSPLADWEETRAYCVSLTTSVGGILIFEDPASEEYRSVREALAQELRSLKDPSSGHSIMKEVWRREELYEGPYVGDAPDLLLVLDPSYQVVEGLVGRAYLPKSDARVSHWRGSHRLEGVLLAGGSPIRPGPLPPSRLEDIAPTVLYLLGLPVPNDMDGRILQEAVRTEWLQNAPPRYTETSCRGAEEGHTEWDHPEDEAEVIDRLRSLGYVE